MKDAAIVTAQSARLVELEQRGALLIQKIRLRLASQDLRAVNPSIPRQARDRL